MLRALLLYARWVYISRVLDTIILTRVINLHLTRVVLNLLYARWVIHLTRVGYNIPYACYQYTSYARCEPCRLRSLS